MIQRLKGMVKKMDIFGVPLQLHIQNEDRLYQSPLGGFITVAIYSISSFYFVYLFYLWQSRQLVPQRNQQTTIPKNGDNLTLTEPLFNLIFTMNNENEGEDPFKDKYLYYTSAHFFQDIEHNQESVIKTDEECRHTKWYDQYFGVLCPNLSNYYETYLYHGHNQNYSNTVMTYGVTFCDTGANDDDQCINRTQIKEPHYKYRKWVLTLYKQDVDLNTGKPQTFENQYTFIFDDDQDYHLQIQLVVTKASVIIDDGYLLSPQKQLDIVKEVEIVPMRAQNEWKNFFNGPVIQIVLGKHSQIVYITFPSITIIISQGLSLFQTLILCGFIINLMNKYNLINFQKHTLVSLYFPQLKDYQFQSHGLCKTKVFKDNKPLTQEESEYIFKFQQNIYDIVRNRLNIFNILSDVIKLQIALQTLEPLHFSKNKAQYIINGTQKRDSFLALEEKDFYNFFCEDSALLDTGQNIKNLNPTDKINNERFLINQPIDMIPYYKVMNDQNQLYQQYN